MSRYRFKAALFWLYVVGMLLSVVTENASAIPLFARQT